MRKRSRNAHHGLWVHAYFLLPGGWAQSERVLSRIIGSYRAIYSNYQSEASAFPQPGGSKGFFPHGRSGDVGNRSYMAIGDKGRMVCIA